MKFEQFLAENILNEAPPLPDQWKSDGKFKKGVPFAQTIKYAQERAEKLGTGSSRVAFEVEYKGQPTVIKVAKNKKGIAQNVEEVNYLEDHYIKDLNILVGLIDYDEENGDDGIKWIHMEKLEKIKDSDFKKYTGGLTCHQLVAHAYNPTVHRSKQIWGEAKTEIFEKALEYMEDNDIDILSDLQDFFHNFYDVKANDLTRLANWGWCPKDKKPKILDIGFNEVTAKLYGQ